MKEEELSEEDAALKEKLDSLVERLQTADDEGRLAALESIGSEIRRVVVPGVCVCGLGCHSITGSDAGLESSGSEL